MLEPDDSHLVALGSWSLWRWARLRGAGFAAARLEALGSPGATGAVDRGDPDVDGAIATALAGADRELAAIAADPRFAEAILWQNRGVYRHAVSGLETSRGARRRKKLRAIYRYLQRYCAKNDTIGFFGPQGLAVLDRDRPTTVVAGPELLRRRRVYFEHWAIAALADRAGADPAISAALKPALLPSLRLEGDELVAAGGRRHRLPAEVAQVLARCDGATRADEIGDDAEVGAILESLVESRVIRWSLAIPTGLERPEQRLREELEAIGADTWLGALERLEGHRAAVSQSAGDVATLAGALADLDRGFEEAAGVGAARRPGQTYAGRTPVWEECLRDVDMTIGGEVLDAVAPGLELLLSSARWYTAELGARVTARAEAIAAGLDAPARYLDLLARLEAEEVFDACAGEVTAELQRRWSAILDLDGAGDAESISRSAAELEEAVAGAFAATGPGWPSARYHSPDILIAAAAVESIAGGQFTAVLGEIHPAVNTCALPVLLDLIDDPQPLLEARERDIGRPLVVPVIARDQATRADHVWRTRADFALEIGSTPAWRPRSEALAIADLFVSRGPRGLVVTHRSERPGSPGELTFDLLDVLDSRLSAAIIGRFDWLPRRPHLPRIAIDDFVVSRRRWRLEPSALASRRTAAETFTSARRLARELGLPDRVFIKIPEEPKPVFADLASPFSTDVIGRLLRGASEVVVTEMLPDLDQTWLPIEGSATATSELRLVAVDPVRWT